MTDPTPPEAVALSGDELSLLLFFETRAVDCSGRVNVAHMNRDDRVIAERWSESGFVLFGRIAAEDCSECSEYGTMWCKLSEAAWAAVHAAREARARRLWNRRTWRTTDEQREDT